MPIGLRKRGCQSRVVRGPYIVSATPTRISQHLLCKTPALLQLLYYCTVFTNTNKNKTMSNQQGGTLTITLNVTTYKNIFFLKDKF